MKLFNVTFEYLEQAMIGNIVADTSEQAVEGARVLVKRGGVKNPQNFAATELDEAETDAPTSKTIN